MGFPMYLFIVNVLFSRKNVINQLEKKPAKQIVLNTATLYHETTNFSRWFEKLFLFPKSFQIIKELFGIAIPHYNTSIIQV
jgi:hypothetical protein